MKVPEVKAPAVASRKRKASEMSEKEKPIATKKRAPSAYQLYMKEQLKVHSDQSPKCVSSASRHNFVKNAGQSQRI